MQFRRWFGLFPLLFAPVGAVAGGIEEDAHHVTVGGKTALFLPTARTGYAVVSPAGSEANRRGSWGGALEVVYRPPLLGHRLGARLEGGFAPLGARAEAELPADPDYGAFEYRWFQSIVPMKLGVSYHRDVTLPPWGPLEAVGPIKASLAVGGVLAPLWSRTTYLKDGEEVRNAVEHATGKGFYLGVEGGYPLGPGDITGELRWVMARTDMGFPELYGSHVNPQPGDLQGTFLRVGYRMPFDF